MHKDTKEADQGDHTDEIDFESAYSELESLVERMEKGDQKLEESLKDFERGVTLLKACNARLSAAEQKIEILVKDSQGVLGTEPFDPDE